MINSKGKGKAPVVLSVKKPSFKKKGQQMSKSEHANGSTSQSKSKGKGTDVQCHHCHKFGHWRRNCPKYLEDIKAGRVTAQGMSSDIHMIEINHASSSTWVFDTGCWFPPL